MKLQQKLQSKPAKIFLIYFLWQEWHCKGVTIRPFQILQNCGIINPIVFPLSEVFMWIETLKKHKISFGIIGFIFVIMGTLLAPSSLEQKVCYLLGSIFLLTMSSLDLQLYFILLQIVILAGAIVAFFPIPVFYKAAVPIALSIFSVLLFLFKGYLKDPNQIFGCLGLLLLAAGYAVSNPIIYFLGGLVVMIYSYISYRRGIKTALLFALLNLVFSVTSAYAIWQAYLR
jgi:hypothetical protein